MTYWINKWEAQRYVGRSQRTLQRWRTTGLVRAGTARDGKVMYDLASLKRAKKIADAQQRRTRFDGSVAGPGRPRKDQQAGEQSAIEF